ESVLIPHDIREHARNTVCLSTQVGCAYGCKFCASGKTGFVRDLTAGEIVEQLVWIQREIRPDRVNNIVFMGMGEPLANYDNVMKAVRIINSPSCAAIGSRKITISTCGLVPGIKRLPAENIQIELSVSLHAPDDRTRSLILPVNKKFPVAILISACREYVRKTNRQITFEYILISGVNDSTIQAEELGRLLKGLNCKLNLIPYNKIEGLDFKSPSAEAVSDFRTALFHAGVKSFIRQARGQDIAGACGQLRLRKMKLCGA
ncbi:MAG: 23S rRNA (adenine(2503)-C(2))-methyltransferase RlmN, partial [Candidatus Omnitrophica bacterium]|nr:23S rRNA (adenine(2503)-C(2))-methyltransferase RlmN [Candidatus Omnitrophota bacterium]